MQCSMVKIVAPAADDFADIQGVVFCFVFGQEFSDEKPCSASIHSIYVHRVSRHVVEGSCLRYRLQDHLVPPRWFSERVR